LSTIGQTVPATAEPTEGLVDKLTTFDDISNPAHIVTLPEESRDVIRIVRLILEKTPGSLSQETARWAMDMLIWLSHPIYMKDLKK
jgi:hypothetical protein